MASGDLKSQCETYFNTSDLYQILSVEQTDSSQKLKKAYHKLSLSIHPDRNPDDVENCTKKFQILSQIYYILSDDNRRAVYDETGSLDDEGFNLPEEFSNWQDYWKLIFPPVTVDAIASFKVDYRDSEREIEDLKTLYNSYSGNFTKILQNHLMYESQDEDRIRNIIQNLINTKEITAYKAFTNEPASKKAARKRFWEKEHRDFEKESKIKKTDAESDLTSQIMSMQKNRLKASENFLDSLAEKYAPKSNKKTGKKK